MLRVSIRRIKPGKEARLRAWLAELNARAEEVRVTFEAETVRAEQAYIIPTREGPLLVYAVEAESIDRAKEAFRDSQHAIDQQHCSVMDECLGESLGLHPAYDVAVNHRDRG
ncbi:MAG TPA: DUF6176 family protein [Candidatus Polarisedimenticolaceae bacterium]|nr:DUF6176 family protein [Candidatus Polarisedimenticolaceae bacterium]